MAFLTILLSGCFAKVSHEKFLPGVETLRTNFVVTIKFVSDINQACRHQVLKASGQSAPWLTYYGACSVILPDSGLLPGVTPTCLIYLPETDWHSALQHEILHCMGYAHE